MKAKITILFTVCFVIWNTNANAQSSPGEIAGVVKDENGDPLPGAIISYERNGVLQGTTTDENGRYRLKPLDAGKYDITYSFIGYRKEIQKGVAVSAGLITFVSVKLLNDNTLPDFEFVYHKGLFEPGETGDVNRLDRETIELAPVSSGDIRNFVPLTPGANQRDDGQDINIRGSRSDATQYYVDGVKMIGGFSIPKSSIKEIAVISGGVPAMFGDATGGIVVITTKSYWDK